MTKNVFTKILSFVLCLSMIFSLAGCKKDPAGSNPAENGDNQDNNSGSLDSAGNGDAGNSSNAAAKGDGIFTLNFDASEPFNPYTCTNIYNRTVSDLLYEGLFAIGEGFETTNVLCESFSTEDGQTYDFTLLPNVIMSDGAAFTADDAVYSIKQAMTSSLYKSRFSSVSAVEKTGDRSFRITLTSKNYMFSCLLDVPMIRNGSIGENTPAGTGPYSFNDQAGNPHLEARKNYRDPSAVPADVIGLSEYDANDISAAFSDLSLDLLALDLYGTNKYNFQENRETKYYNTTIMQYVGFNANSPALSDQQFRLALSYCINREDIVSSVYDGHALASPLAMSPYHYLYPAKTAELYPYSLISASGLLASIGMDDSNSDSFLEYPYESGMGAITLDFIVNSDNANKLEAARMIASGIKKAGINVNLRELSWDEYSSALSSGNFDMYYAEVKLQPDFDLSSLLLPGGSLNYGGINDEQYGSLISICKTSAGTTAQVSVSQLLDYTAQQAHIVPVLFRQQAVITHINSVSGLTPTISSIFYKIEDFKINVG